MQFGRRDVFRFDGQLSGVYCLLGKVVFQEWSRSCGRLEWLYVIGPRFLELDYCSEQDQNVATVTDGFISTNAVLTKVA